MSDQAEIQARFEQATMWLARGEYSRAEPVLRAILAQEPSHRAGCNNLAACLFGLGKYTEALQLFSRMAGNQPADAQAHYNAGCCLRELGNTEQAIRAYRQALMLRPGYREARENLANLLADGGLHDAALPLYEEGINIEPDRADNYRQAAFQRRERGAPGDLELARATLDRAIERQIAGGDALRLVRAMLMLPVSGSSAEISEWRTGLIEALAQFEKAPLVIADPLREVGMVPFFLAYHGEQDRDINASLARVLRLACPALGFRNPRMTTRRSRPRIGIVTAYAGQHTTARYFYQSLKSLEKHAEIRTYYAGRAWRRQFDTDSLKPYRELPGNLAGCHAMLAAEELDILIYPEIGIHPLPHLLAHARLAPVQIALYGQPVTTGIPGIDYFLSHAGSEPDHAAADYTEQLLLLPEEVSAACISPRKFDIPRRTRTDFGLPENRRIYLCAQSLFKIHPDFDNVLGELLRRDPEGELVLFAMRGHWGERVIERLRKNIPSAAGRIRMMPFLPLADFMAFASCCDVALDTHQYSGGGTSYDCLQAGLPIVTLPGRFMRARQTAALYRRMEINELIAKDTEDYLRIALTLAHDSAEQRRLRSRIIDGHTKLYNDHDSADAFCQLVLNAPSVE